MTNPVPLGPSGSSPAEIPTRADLGSARAIWNALWGRDVDFYPRIIDDAKITSMPTEVMMAELGTAAANWGQLNAAGLADALSLARQSLDEAKQQTEYQDEKATRLLTITTFLSALSGALFTRFADAFPLSSLYQMDWMSKDWVWVVYILFAASVMTGLSGAIVIFHATRTRFKYPPLMKASRQDEDPKSLLFFSALIRVRPRGWMRAWVADPAPGAATAQIRGDLQSRYLYNLVSETYLISAKAADKLRYLEPAQNLLAVSLRLLFVWLMVLTGVSVLVPTVKAPPRPSDMRLVGPNAVIPIDVRSRPSPIIRPVVPIQKSGPHVGAPGGGSHP